MKTDTAISMYAVAYTNYKNLLQGTLLKALPNYWQAGCIFDTTLDFLALVTSDTIHIPVGAHRITIKEAQENITAVLAKYNCDAISSQDGSQTVPANVYYNGSSNIPGAAQCANWYDDAGWWGIACAKAFDPYYQHLFTPETMAKAKNIAKACWKAMNTGTYTQNYGAPNVYKTAKKQNNAYVNMAAPRYPGGLWQANFGDPLTASLGPFQDSVVNGLWFTLCTRLYKMSDDKSLKDEIAPYISSFVQFFKSWINDPEYSILFKMENTSSLVRERYPAYSNSVTHYKADILVNPKAWYEANTCWAGDQGLYLGGLYELSTINLSEKHFAYDTMELILNGILNMTTTPPIESLQTNIIAPWYPYTPSNGLAVTDPGDYASGAGICMRYLLYGFLKGKNPISKKLSDHNSSLYKLIKDSAKACKENTYPSYSNQSFNQFNSLAILTTAMALGKFEID